MVDEAFELFLELGANDDQCNFPVVYASGMQGIAGMEPEDLADDLEPLFDTIVKEVRIVLSKAIQYVSIPEIPLMQGMWQQTSIFAANDGQPFPSLFIRIQKTYSIPFSERICMLFGSTY